VAVTVKTPAPIVRRNGLLLAASMLGTFAALRVHLAIDPNADLTVAGYNIHHLFTGLLLVAAGGVPLAIFRGSTWKMHLALVVFGIGLGMALDEWVFLVATDGTNASYLLPVSFWGGLAVVGLSVGYAGGLVAWRLLHPAAPRAGGDTRPGGGG
jgi:hypothetical protein